MPTGVATVELLTISSASPDVPVPV